MNRREALSTLSRGAALGALAGTAVVAVSCQPIAAPAAELDPGLEALVTYRRQMDAFNATPSGMSDEGLDALRDRTWGPFYERAIDDPSTIPACESLAGVAMALRVLLREQNLCRFDEAILCSALAYFDGRAA